MKSNRNSITAAALVLFLLMQAFTVYGQENKGYQDLNVRIDQLAGDSEDEDGNLLTNLTLEIESNKIINPQKIYVKVKSVSPREIYFIRAMEYELFEGGVDIKAWEKEKDALEKERAKERKEKGDLPGNRKYKELWSAKRYEKQEGRSLKMAGLESGDAVLEFGPFSPGEYEVYVGVKDESSMMHINTQIITITRN